MKQNIIGGTLVGLMMAFVTLCLSAGYFVGYIMAIGFAFLYCFLKNIKNVRTYFRPMLAWGIMTFSGAVAYLFVLLSFSRSFAFGGGSASAFSLGLFLKSYALFWSGALLPAIWQATQSVCVLVGALFCVFAAFLTYRYLRSDQGEKSLFPVMCLFYPAVIGLVIAYSRIGTFGYKTMLSSRYVAESAVGVMGVLWMSFDLLFEKRRSIQSLAAGLAVCMLAASFACIAKYETGNAPYIRRFFDNAEVKLLDYENCSDNFLIQVSASDPEVARECLRFLDKENLSIFAE